MLGEQELLVIAPSGSRNEKLDGQAPAELYDFAWGESLLSLISWIEGGPVSMLGLPNMRHTSELNLAAYMSAAQGDRIDLPLTDFSLAEWPLEAIAARGT